MNDGPTAPELRRDRAEFGGNAAMKFAMSSSFGKDSALALHKMIRAGHDPICLITTVNSENGRTWSHGINPDVVQRTADTLGLPVVTASCHSKNYADEFERALLKSAEMGAECCVFGDMDREPHLDWNISRCRAAGIECVVPLWKIDREQAVVELIDSGFTAIIKVVEKKYLTEEFLGKTLDKELIEKIRLAGADVCGENGEYHTFVTDGPIFKEAVPITLGGIIDLGSYAAIDIRAGTPCRA
jgi:uncharacterized protein (TIGR00290 family)